MTSRIFNVRWFKVGGIRFLILGRINISFSISRPKPPECDDTEHRAYEPMLGIGGH